MAREYKSLGDLFRIGAGWPAYDAELRTAMTFDTTSGVVEDWGAPERDLWLG
jgi:hypothetical protein